MKPDQLIPLDDPLDEDFGDLVVKLNKEFHSYWLANDAPDPSTAEYLLMVKSFWFSQGFMRGIEISVGKNND